MRDFSEDGYKKDSQGQGSLENLTLHSCLLIDPSVEDTVQNSAHILLRQKKIPNFFFSFQYSKYSPASASHGEYYFIGHPSFPSPQNTEIWYY